MRLIIGAIGYWRRALSLSGVFGAVVQGALGLALFNLMRW